MQPSLLTLLAACGLTRAHTIFQQVSVNGVEQGNLVGLRAPDSNDPVVDVSSSAMSCNTGLTHISSDVIDIPAGATVGNWWEHVIGGPQGANDADNPVASSHKGPVMVYLAKVDNAATASTDGLKWFKVAQETLNNGVWGVDSMISGGGWWTFTMPSCIAPGNYLMRAEILALHSAYAQGGAQFFIECAQINITGDGSLNPETVSLPGAYSASDPGILINIFGATGQPDNGGNEYTAPGPDPISCAGNSNEVSPATTLATSIRRSTAAAVAK